MKREYALDQEVTTAQLGDELFIGAGKYTSNVFAGEDDVAREDLPTTPGIVVMRLQRNKDLHGFIKVRWGAAFAKDTVYAEFGEGGLESM